MATFADIRNRVYFLTGTDSNSYSNANLTLATGRALERVVSLINRYDSRRQFDDSNYSDLQMATLAITSGQQQYSLSTSHLTIDRIEIKDLSGNWTRLTPLDQQDIKRGRTQAIALGETTPSTGRSGAYKATVGTPTEYDVIGISFFLFPVPDYTQTKSIRIYFTRPPLLFDYTTGQFTDSTGSTASSPGFNSLFHDLVPLWASYDYAFAFGKQNANAIFTEIIRKEQELVEFYGGINRDERPRMSQSGDSNK